MTVPDRRRILINWAILVAAVVVLGGALFAYYRAVTTADAGKRGRGKGFRFTVKTAPVQRETLHSSIPLQGDVVSNASATIRAEIDGVVRKVLVQNGQAVKAGDVLLELDDKDLVLAVRRQQALAMEAYANGVRSAATIAKARDLLKRLTGLDKHKLVSAESLEQARIDLRSAQAAAAQARAQAALRHVELLTAKRNLHRTKIRAPVAGRVAKRLVAVGDRAAVSTPVVQLEGKVGLELQLYVPVASANRVRAQSAVRYRLAGRKGAWRAGHISRVLPTADPASRNQTVVVSLPDRLPGYTPGLAVEARLTVGHIPDALVVGSDALTRFGERWVVFTVARGKARRVPVTILGEDDRKLAVRGALKVGDPVVIVGNEALFPGAPVRVVGPPAGASAARR